MYICPICNKEFDKEEAIVKHLNKCWKEKNPNQQSKPSPRSEDIITREVNNDVANFFDAFKKE